MIAPQKEPGSEPSTHTLAEVIKEVRTSLIQVIKSDMLLAKAEMKDAVDHVKRDVASVAIFGVVAMLGILPLMAFMVIGLGSLLGGMYWLSALIVSVIFFGIGGVTAYAAVRRLGAHDLSMPHTRRVLDEEVAIIDRKLHRLAETSKKLDRRSA